MEQFTEAQITRLEATLKLLDGAATEGEAQAANAALQRQLLKMALDEQAARQLAGSKVETDQIVIKMFNLHERGKTGLTWKIYLIDAVAEYNLCKSLRAGKHGATVYLIGTERNIAYVMTMFEHNVEVFTRVARASYDALDGWQKSTANKVSWTNSFLMGVPSGLRLKFREERTDLYKNEDGMQGLVVRNDEDLMDVIHANWPKLGTSGRDQISNNAAYHAGREAGRTQSQDRPISRPDGVKALA